MSKIKDLLSQCIRDPQELGVHFSLSPEQITLLEEIAQKYPICVPPYYMDLIGKDVHTDPIRKLCLPDIEETSLEGRRDTSGEEQNTVVKGMQHKYGPTALVLTTNQCSMYCRHCFRKRMVGSTAEEIASHLGEMVDYVKKHKEITNVLLSGGDALVNENDKIRDYLEAFSSIDSLKYIRIGTRTPVVLPERIYGDEELLDILRTYGKKKQIIVVTHFNHPREVTPEAARAVRCLLEAGIPVRNQTVLLKDINDDADTMAELLESLVSIGVLPYYVFQCRPAMGVMKQFQVPLLEGSRIIDAAKAKISGQAKMVRYCMSHVTGKIEILGCPDGNDRMLFKYHQAKYPKDSARIFYKTVGPEECWLEEIPQ